MIVTPWVWPLTPRIVAPPWHTGRACEHVEGQDSSLSCQGGVAREDQVLRGAGGGRREGGGTCPRPPARKRGRCPRPPLGSPWKVKTSLGTSGATPGGRCEQA